MPEKELKARQKNIDLLRKNINILEEEFKQQTNKHKGAGLSPDKKKNGSDLYGINRESLIDDDDERDLNDDEKDLLEEFRNNDKEIDSIMD